MGGIVNLIAEVIFVPIIAFCIIGWVVFKRKRKNDRKRKVLELQQEEFGKPWDPISSSGRTDLVLPYPQPVYGNYTMGFPPKHGRDQAASQPVLHGTHEQQHSNATPWDQSIVYTPPAQQVVYGH